MRRARLLVAVVALACGCLRTPPAPGSVDLGRVVDGGGGDGGGGACLAFGAAMDFPPAGWTLAVREARRADLDCDGVDDLVLLNAVEGAEAGLYLLRGGASGFGARFDAFVATAGVAPYAIEIADVTGSPRADLLVYGRIGSASYLVVLEGDDAGGFMAPRSRRVEDPLMLPSGDAPWTIAVGALVDGKRALVVGSRSNAHAALVGDWSQAGLDALTFEVLPTVCRQSRGVVRAVVDGRDLYGVGGVCAFRFREQGGVFGNGAVARDYGATSGYIVRNDLVVVDGKRAFVGTDGGPLSAVLVDETLGSYAPMSMTRAPDLAVDDVRAGALDGNPAPDLVLLDRTASSTSSLTVVENLALGAGVLRIGATVGPFVFAAGAAPAVVAVGDFDGDGAAEMRPVDATGRLRCVRLDTTFAAHALVACP